MISLHYIFEFSLHPARLVWDVKAGETPPAPTTAPPAAPPVAPETPEQAAARKTAEAKAAEAAKLVAAKREADKKASDADQNEADKTAEAIVATVPSPNPSLDASQIPGGRIDQKGDVMSPLVGAVAAGGGKKGEGWNFDKITNKLEEIFNRIADILGRWLEGKVGTKEEEEPAAKNGFSKSPLDSSILAAKSSFDAGTSELSFADTSGTGAHAVEAGQVAKIDGTSCEIKVSKPGDPLDGHIVRYANIDTSKLTVGQALTPGAQLGKVAPGKNLTLKIFDAAGAAVDPQPYMIGIGSEKKPDATPTTPPASPAQSPAVSSAPTPTTPASPASPASSPAAVAAGPAAEKPKQA